MNTPKQAWDFIKLLPAQGGLLSTLASLFKTIMNIKI